jgi:hypothetical protein
MKGSNIKVHLLDYNGLLMLRINMKYPQNLIKPKIENSSLLSMNSIMLKRS